MHDYLLCYLEATGIRIIIRINQNIIVPYYLCPATDAGNDGRKITYRSFLLNPACKDAADIAFMYEEIARL
jgi:hypothetical protein